jgi:[ribosomal protein S18]-alanine N-acetyltransferase
MRKSSGNPASDRAAESREWSALKIRPATPADADAMIQLGRSSPTAPQWSESQYRQLFTQQHARKLVLIIETDDGRIHGFLVASRVESEWELESIVVDPSAARRGLGTQLLSELIAHVASAGGGSIFLEVRAGNAAARGLYEKCDFQPAGLRKLYYSNPPEDAVLYRVAVGPVSF